MPPLNHARAWRLLLTLSLSLMACAHPDLSAGRAALGGGRYEEATWAFERALADRDAAIDALRGLAAAYRGLGGQALRASDCTSARAHFALAAALSKPLLMDAQAIYECASARGAPRALLKADLLRLATLGDQRARVLAPLMRMHLQDQEHAQGVAYVPHLERRASITTPDRAALARAYLKLNRVDEAYVQLAQVVAADPHDALARLKLAELQEARGEQEMARRTYEALTVDFRDNPVVYLRYAAYATRRGDHITAQAMINEANRIRGLSRPKRVLRALPKSRR